MSEPTAGETWAEMARALADPDGLVVRERSGRGGLTFSYIDARQVMDRLDAVVGMGGWSDSYRQVGDAIECSLTVLGVTKVDVGYPNNPDHPEDEALKSAFSDALKRAAVKFGIGRFLYSGKPSGRGASATTAQPTDVGGSAETAAVCQECGDALGETRFKDGTVWTPAQLAAFGQRKHGRVLCMSHYRDANESRRARAARDATPDGSEDRPF